jgi:hypothetical protein
MDLMGNFCGVPQGSVLLFLLFIEDLSQLDLFRNLQLFADDTVLSYSRQDWSILQVEINAGLLSVGNWLFNNELRLNVLKSAYMVPSTL